MQVQKAVEEYLTVKQAKPHTLEEHTRILGTFCAWCADKQIALDDLKARMLSEYTRYLFEHLHSKHQGPVSSHTVALHIRVLKAFLRWCALDEDFEQHVKLTMIARIENPKKECKLVDTFTEAQIKALFNACEQEYDDHLALRARAILALLFDTGIRAAELCGLCLDQVDISAQDPHIRVFGKGDKWREVGLGKQSRKELSTYIRQYRKQAQGTHSPVFLTYKSTPLQVQDLQETLERLSRIAKIQGVRCSPHTCRHTWAVLFMRNGGNIYQLSKLMGHTSVVITENYLKSFRQTDARRGACNPLDGLFKRGEQGEFDE